LEIFPNFGNFGNMNSVSRDPPVLAGMTWWATQTGLLRFRELPFRMARQVIDQPTTKQTHRRQTVTTAAQRTKQDAMVEMTMTFHLTYCKPPSTKSQVTFTSKLQTRDRLPKNKKK
jgi:hypothetical protein